MKVLWKNTVEGKRRRSEGNILKKHWRKGETRWKSFEKNTVDNMYKIEEMLEVFWKSTVEIDVKGKE